MWVFVVSMTSHFKDTIAEVREVLMDQRWAETEDKCYVRITKEQALKILSLIDRLEKLERVAKHAKTLQNIKLIGCDPIDNVSCAACELKDALAALEEK